MAPHVVVLTEMAPQALIILLEPPPPPPPSPNTRTFSNIYLSLHVVAARFPCLYLGILLTALLFSCSKLGQVELLEHTRHADRLSFCASMFGLTNLTRIIIVELRRSISQIIFSQEIYLRMVPTLLKVISIPP